MHIRAATASDLAVVVGCESLAFPTFRYNQDVEPGGNLALRIREGSLYLICSRERVLGYISFSSNVDHLFVHIIAVLPAFHDQGLGSQLLAFAEKEAQRLRLRSVTLFTDGDIAQNHIFYRRRGYHETDRCGEGGFSRVYYAKDVTPQARST